MKITPTLAKILFRLSKGEQLPASSARQKIILKMIDAGIIQRSGRVRQKLWVSDIEALHTYLHNKFSITDLGGYIQTLQKDKLGRGEQTRIASDSKLRQTRTFQGFLVNSYTSISAQLHGRDFMIAPKSGTFQFIYDFEDFTVPGNITVIGVENAENFRFIEKQAYLFNHCQPLFVSRYPQTQSKDLIQWLQRIPNGYGHYGDFDFAGIDIYQQEFKKHLGDKAQFFVPENIEEKIKKFGNPSLYNHQPLNTPVNLIEEENVQHLIKLIHQYKKGLEQEVFIEE